MMITYFSQKTFVLAFLTYAFVRVRQNKNEQCAIQKLMRKTDTCTWNYLHKSIDTVLHFAESDDGRARMKTETVPYFYSIRNTTSRLAEVTVMRDIFAMIYWKCFRGS